ncbi:MAG: TlpA disulfide reductase family protein [Caldimonas sp.]
MNRRRAATMAAAAALAAIAGGGTAWWRGRTPEEDEAAPPKDVWSLSFPKPQGGTLAMAELRGRPLLLNFWATWCAPCVSEMPLLDQFARERAESGWQVLALAIDGIDPVKRFLAERSLHLPVALAGAEGVDLSRSLGNRLGGLPFSVVFDSAGQAFARNLGAVSPALLAAWVGFSR